jgi:hypothetical protein
MKRKIVVRNDDRLNKRIASIPMPSRIAKLQVSAEGFPIPWFVQWIKGEPDFRIMDGEKLSIAVRHKRCWICGEQLGQFMCFAIGPMCMINRVSA